MIIMGYYTDYVIECDTLTFGRMLHEWKEKRGEYETELPRPDYIWVNKSVCSSEGKEETGDDLRHLMYFCINHGPYAGDVYDWLCIDLGLDDRHFLLKIMTEDDNEWRTYGNMFDLSGYKDVEYDEKTHKMKEGCIPDGWVKNEYCCIIINPDVWVPYDVDYTSDNVIAKPTTEELLREIIEKLDNIEGTLLELFEQITSRK